MSKANYLYIRKRCECKTPKIASRQKQVKTVQNPFAVTLANIKIDQIDVLGMPLESQSGCVVQGALILTQIQDLPGICLHGWLIQNLINDFLGLTNKPAPVCPSNMHPRSSKQLLTARVAASSPHMAGPHGRIAIYKPSKGRLKVTETCTTLHWATAVIWG